MYFVHPQIRPVKYCSAVISLLLAKSFNRVKLNKQLSFYFPDKQFIFTDMGRAAFRAIIEKMNLQNSEMLLPAYICDIFYPILKNYNIKPIFLDIDLKTFHVKIEEIRNKITPNTRSILICHTYGLPVDIREVRQAVGGVIIIEDCAHAFFTQKSGVYAGNFGDISFFSLYKQLPSLRGGMLVCPRNWKINLSKTAFNLRDFLSFLNYFWPLAFFFKKFGSDIAPKMLRKEKLSEPAGLAVASLGLFSGFFEDIEKSMGNRRTLAVFFQEELQKIGFEVQKPDENVFCYLSALTPNNLREKRDEIVQKLKKYGVFCTRIWHAPIILNEDVQGEYNLDLSEFPNTIDAAKRIINFPLQNHYKKRDIIKMAEAIKGVIKEVRPPDINVILGGRTSIN